MWSRELEPTGTERGREGRGKIVEKLKVFPTGLGCRWVYKTGRFGNERVEEVDDGGAGFDAVCGTNSYHALFLSAHSHQTEKRSRKAYLGRSAEERRGPIPPDTGCWVMVRAEEDKVEIVSGIVRDWKDAPLVDTVLLKSAGGAILEGLFREPAG